jgi:hypothetical protein
MQTLSTAVLLLTGLLAVTGARGQLAPPQRNPVGNWTGVIIQQQRNIAVRLTVTSLEIGNPSGDMRWGNPLACSLQMEYSGMRDTQYAFNIAGSNGGWCDLYRDGTLFLVTDGVKRGSVVFQLADQQGRRSEQGVLDASLSEPQKVSNTPRPRPHP